MFAGLIRSVVGVFRGAPHVSLTERLRLLAALTRFTFTLLRRGAKLSAVARFIHSRHFLSQLLLAPNRGLVFLTSMPYTFGQNPWVIEIEDPTTLFYPLIENGRTSDLRIGQSPYLPIVRALLESDSCKGIVTHIRSTAELVPTLFGEAIRKKVFYTPLGVPLPPRFQRHRDRGGDEIHLLFINSWCQVPENFFVRGGLDVLEAFAVLRERYPQLRLTLRTALPALDAHYHRILESGGVRLIQRFVTADEMAALHADSHIFLLPAARIHIVSLLQAMSYGMAVVGSDGWGMEEYLHHERNGLVVKGRYGKVSWADETAGLLREDYEPMVTPDPEVIEGLVEAVSRLVEDRTLRGRLGLSARADVETKYTLAQWNEGLKEVFDRAGEGMDCRAATVRERSSSKPLPDGRGSDKSSRRRGLRPFGLFDVGGDHVFDRPLGANAALLQPQAFLAQPRQHVEVVAHHDQDAGLFHHLVQAPLRLALKGQVAGAEDFIDEQDFRLDRGGGREGQPHHHAGRVVAHGDLEEVAQLAEVGDVRRLVADAAVGFPLKVSS